MTDPIADMLTRIRNAVHARHTRVDIPVSRFKAEIAKILEREGYIAGFKVVDAAVKKAYREADEKNFPLFKKKLQFIRFTPDELAAFRKVGGEPVWEEWVVKREAQGIPARELLNFILTQAGAKPKS